MSLRVATALADTNEVLIGHRSTALKFSATLSLFKFRASARKDGNPDSFLLPLVAGALTPDATTSYVRITFEGGVLFDPLAAGEWKGSGQPEGRKGWKYINKRAPHYGPIEYLKVNERSIKIIARGLSSLPAPDGSSGSIHTVIHIGGVRYCAEAKGPHTRERPGSLKATEQSPATVCEIECDLGDDTDYDYLTDCVETDTKVYVDSNDTGTDPYDEDTDDDGLRDGDETVGSVNGLDLPALGVSPLRRDLLVEYDWFEDDLECGPHSHRPSPEMLQLLKDMYADAPISNPDGSTGINLIQDIGQGGALDGGKVITGASPIVESWYDLYEENFTPDRATYFRHVVAPHGVPGGPYSGGAILDRILVVVEGCHHNPLGGAIVMAHELGHTMGLWHGGNTPCNGKPNYNSIMNYRYAAGASADCYPTSDGVLDYSDGANMPLDETNLDEHAGICGSTPVDWNENTILESGVAVDLNGGDDDTHQLSACGGIYTVLEDHDDWGNLRMGSFRSLMNLPVPGAYGLKVRTTPGIGEVQMCDLFLP